LPLPFVRPFASNNSLPLAIDDDDDDFAVVGSGGGAGGGKGGAMVVDLSEFQGAGTPVPYVSFSGPRWRTVGWERRVMRDKTAP
jgi:hypothetical protein